MQNAEETHQIIHQRILIGIVQRWNGFAIFLQFIPANVTDVVFMGDVVIKGLFMPNGAEKEVGCCSDLLISLAFPAGNSPATDSIAPSTHFL